MCSLNVIDAPEATFTFPASIKSNTASCNTSEYTSKSSNSECKKPFNTAFATDPIPDCKGASLFVNRPASISARKNVNKCSAI